jgi:hypothetical protein
MDATDYSTEAIPERDPSYELPWAPDTTRTDEGEDELSAEQSAKDEECWRRLIRGWLEQRKRRMTP